MSSSKTEYCPYGHGKMEHWSGGLRCRKCGYTIHTEKENVSVSSSTHKSTLKNDSTNNNFSMKKEIGFWDRLTGKGIEMLVDEYSEIYGEILLGMHRELTTQKKKISDFENYIKELEKLNDTFEKDNNIKTEGKHIIELAKKLAENIAKINNDNLKSLNDTRHLIEAEFKKISQSLIKSKYSITQSISENSKTINQKIQFIGEKLSLVKASISKQTIENDKKFSLVLEKSDTNKSLLTKSLNWNRVFIILTFITNLTILGILLWITNLL